MRENSVRVYVHLVWATWDRLPLLTGKCQMGIYACLQAECLHLKTELLAIGGVEDHVHLLISLPATVTLAELVKQLKGSSSHLANHQLKLPNVFKWQGSYGAFSVSEAGIAEVKSYIANQARHNQDPTLDNSLEPHS